MAVWGDDREIAFLRGLGNWPPQTASRSDSCRRNLLKKYYNTMHLRNNWGEVDPNKVRGYLRQCGAHKGG